MADIWDLGRPATGGGVWDLGQVAGTSVLAPNAVQDIGDAVMHGIQSSATGLLVRGQLPEQQLPENAPWYHRIGAGAGGMLTDLPLSVVGAVGGAAAGGAVTGPAAPAGAVVGGFAGAFAAPMALREALITAYNHNAATSWQGVWDIAKAAMIGGGKGAIIGAATGGAGRVVAPLVAGAPLAARVAAPFGAELTALTATSAALEGHMPTWQDFMDNAILLAGAKGAVKVAGGLRDLYVQTGKHPAEVVAEAAKDPAAKDALLKGELPEAYKPLALEQRVKAALDADQRPELAAELLRQAKDPEAQLLKDPVRYEYITDRETAEGVVRAAAEVYKEAVEAQRRGTVPTEKSFADAVRLVEEGKLKPREIGSAANDAEIAARAALTKGAAERARKVAAEMPEDPALWTPEMKLRMAASLEQVGLFYGELAGVGAEAGRALRMLREIKRNPDRLGDAKALVKIYEGKGSMADVAAMVRALKDPNQVRVFAERFEKATGFEMLVEGWKAAILSGIHTTGANIFGNIGKKFMDVPTSAVQATYEAAMLGAKGTPMPLALYKAKALSPLYGIYFGAKDALTVAREVWNMKGEHLEKADTYKQAIPGKAGEIIRFPFRWLQIQDAFFRTFGERGKAYELAVERAGKEGFDPHSREFAEAVVRYTEKPQLGLTEKDAQSVTKQIEQAGAEDVFAQQLGPRMNGVSRAVQGTPVEFIFPFRRTPVNLLSWAVQHTPGLNIMSARWWADYNAGGAGRARALARVTVGSALAMTAFSMAENGLLTGGGLFISPKERATKKGAQIQPYSIMVGDKYYSIARLEPVAKILMLAADLYEMHQVAGEEDKAKIGPMAVLAFGNATVSTTYMSGLSNAMGAVMEPERKLDSFLEQYAMSLVPKIVGQTVAMNDPYQREIDGVLEALQSQTPFIREKLLPKRDVWGEKVPNQKLLTVLPVQTSEASKDKVKTEAVRLRIGISDAPKMEMEKGPFSPGDKSIELTGKQRDVIREVSGKQAMEWLAPIVNSPDWETIPDFAKIAIYKDFIKDARKEARFKALPADAAERQEMQQKIIDRILRETQAAENK